MKLEQRHSLRFEVATSQHRKASRITRLESETAMTAIRVQRRRLREQQQRQRQRQRHRYDVLKDAVASGVTRSRWPRFEVRYSHGRQRKRIPSLTVHNTYASANSGTRVKISRPHDVPTWALHGQLQLLLTPRGLHAVSSGVQERGLSLICDKPTDFLRLYNSATRAKAFHIRTSPHRLISRIDACTRARLHLCFLLQVLLMHMQAR